MSHASILIDALAGDPECRTIALEKDVGETRVVGQNLINTPAWRWPER